MLHGAEVGRRLLHEFAVAASAGALITDLFELDHHILGVARLERVEVARVHRQGPPIQQIPNLFPIRELLRGEGHGYVSRYLPAIHLSHSLWKWRTLVA